MKIATWNVAYGRGDKPNKRRREMLDQVDADVWVLTETHCDLTPGEEYEPFASDERRSPGNRNVDEHSSWVTVWARKALNPHRATVTRKERTAACTIETKRGRMWIFGTVLPWYTDRETTSVADEVAHQVTDWRRLSSQCGGLGCVAGDFNVDLGGGPHYYGSRESNDAVCERLREAELELLTGFPLTAPDSAFGLIDHIAVSREIKSLYKTTRVWPKVNDRGQRLSDHPGVAVVIDLD